MSHSSVFALGKEQKNINFHVFFTRQPLVATFNEAHAPTFRKFVAEQDIGMANSSKIFQTFKVHSSFFALEKQPKNLNFHCVFTS